MFSSPRRWQRRIPPVFVGPLLLLRLAFPVALTLLLLLWDVAANSVTLHPLESRSAVVTLVRNQLFDAVDVDLHIARTRLSLIRRQLGHRPSRLDQRCVQRGRIALV